MKTSIKYLFGMLTVLASMSASAIPTISWSFNLPSTSTSSQNPPYPLVATFTLTEVGSNVLFVLDPNELSPGVQPDPENSFVNRINFVYSGRALDATDYTNIIASSLAMSPDSHIGVKGVSYKTNPNNMDSSYVSNDQHIVIDFVPRNRPNRFGFNDTSSWTIAGVSLADFTGTYATSNSHPSPTFGIISVSPYSFNGASVCGPTGIELCSPSPSNWVTGPVAAIPEPETYAMLLAGLGLLGFSARRRMKNI